MGISLITKELLYAENQASEASKFIISKINDFRKSQWNSTEEMKRLVDSIKAVTGPVLKNLAPEYSQELSEKSREFKTKFKKHCDAYATASFLKEELEKVIVFLKEPSAKWVKMPLFINHAPENIEEVKQRLGALPDSVQPLQELLNLFDIEITSFYKEITSEKYCKVFADLNQISLPEKGAPDSLKDPLIGEFEKRNADWYSSQVLAQHSNFQPILDEQFETAQKIFGGVRAQVEIAKEKDSNFQEIAKEALSQYQNFVQTLIASCILIDEFRKIKNYLKERESTYLNSPLVQEYCSQHSVQIACIKNENQTRIKNLEFKEEELLKAKERLLNTLTDPKHVRAMNRILTIASKGSLNVGNRASIFVLSVLGYGVNPVESEVKKPCAAKKNEKVSLVETPERGLLGSLFNAFGW